MKTLILILLAAGAAALQDMPETTEPHQSHRWLQQLVGEWTVTAEATMEPGAEPMRMESSESVRSIGDLWILAEGSATFGETPFSSVLTLGYDVQKEVFVGTWIDSMQTHLWSYRGKLDDSRKVLTLDAEGPSFSDPTQTAQYRDVIELLGPDHKVLTSSVQGEDGTWTSFMRAEYRRKK